MFKTVYTVTAVHAGLHITRWLVFTVFTKMRFFFTVFVAVTGVAFKIGTGVTDAVMFARVVVTRVLGLTVATTVWISAGAVIVTVV